jgi:hypothetical protein
MPDPLNEVKSAIATEEITLAAREGALEASAKTWYETHLPLLSGIAGLTVGLLAGHFVKL